MNDLRRHGGAGTRATDNLPPPWPRWTDRGILSHDTQPIDHRTQEQMMTHSATDMTAAAVRLFEAELALSDARQTGVTEWIVAASDRLHAAAVAYAESRRAVRAPTPALFLVA